MSTCCEPVVSIDFKLLLWQIVLGMTIGSAWRN